MNKGSEDNYERHEYNKGVVKLNRGGHVKGRRLCYTYSAQKILAGRTHLNQNEFITAGKEPNTAANGEKKRLD